jgi:hypothetical protein
MRLEPHRLVFLDETGTTTKMTRLRGRCLKGQRLRSKAPFGHWKTQTFIAGLRCHGLTAPFVVDAPMNRRIFETYVETQLVPTLEKGDVVILDNLSAHKSPVAEQAIRAKGAWILFLPPYSPVIACMGILKSRADFYGSASLAACERSWSAWIRNVSEGNSPGGTVHRAAYLYSVGSWNPNHDAIIRIGGEVPG